MVLVIERLHKHHPNGGPNALFDQINANVSLGERVAILGQSGQGKSTMLRMLARLEPFDGGSLTLQGRHVTKWHPCDWRKKVCYVPQLPAMLPVTVADNLSAVSQLHGQPFDKPLAIELMEQVGLAQLDWRQKAADLSGGQKQRLQLVRSLMLRPDVLLLDEVTSALDVNSKHAVESLLVKWSEREGTSLIWVTHDREQAMNVSHRLWHLQGGQLSENAGSAGWSRTDITSVGVGGEDECLL
ncbi:ABC transporter ATP-binding protein [Paenibacillus sedimenti]|uniref:ATP-binding cassette domain-containing protein n=1 Tax=Paenibacillus sedimenti TaxID=2770274 RepID=A0A926QIR8_9BACL|nr:ATP-binding cassette domain-containing protein [Paenibacillus sedimenti]MBD0380800.1 ATP-binding cassette domain-containing protein [Paenibacillus sedimenti]